MLPTTGMSLFPGLFGGQRWGKSMSIHIHMDNHFASIYIYMENHEFIVILPIPI